MIGAAGSGDADMLRRILAEDPRKLKEKDAKGKTPLMWASMNCRVSAVKVLLDAGADVAATDAEGLTALALACSDNIETIGLLLKAKSDPDIHAKNGAMPLAIVITQDRPEVALLLIEAGASVHAKDKWGYEAICLAVNKHLDDVVKALLAHGADPNYMQPETVWPVIMEPIIANKPEFLGILLDAGANVRVKDANKMTPLMYARSARIVKLLLGAGAEVDAIDAFGLHALHYIAPNGEKAAIDLVGNGSATMRYVEKMTKDFTVIAVFAKQREEVASYFAQQAAYYFPASIEYLGLVPDDVFGEDARERRIVIVCSEASGSAYWTPGSINLFSKHISNPAIKQNYVSVVYHELGHNYFRGGSEIAWFIEGVNSYLPIAAAEAGLLDPAKLPVEGIRGIWNFGNTKTDGDRPCIEDFKNTNFSYFYSKSFKIQHIIFKELGNAKYRAFVRAVLDEVFMNPKTSSEDCERIIGLLEKQKAIDWKTMLQGWVFPGKYVKYTPASFGDMNKNKIPDIDEMKADT
jgi:ankyrin repeat protein